MKVRELIAELQQYKNQEAEVTILANCINPDMEEYDEELTYIECWGTDSEDRKSTRLNSSHSQQSRMPSSA
mgnify:CR=1 FL=1